MTSFVNDDNAGTSMCGKMSTDIDSGPEVIFKTCVAMKFVDDDNDDDDDDDIHDSTATSWFHSILVADRLYPH